MTKILITLTLAFLGYEITYSQVNSSYDYWESRILNNISIDSVIKSLDKPDFNKYFSKSKIPNVLIDTLSIWEESRFKIANPNQRYNKTDYVRNRRLPWRKIHVIYKNLDYFVMIYRKGGFVINDYIMWCQMENDRVIDIWIGYCRTSNYNIPEIQKSIIDNVNDLHTNFLSY